MSKLLSRITNTGTIMAIVSACIIIAQQLGFNFNVDAVNKIVTALCTIGVTIGVLNNPTTSGIDNLLKE